MNDKRVNQYLILPEQGQRKDTKLAVEHGEEQIAELLKQGYVIVNQDDFNKLIGNSDGEYLIADDGVVYPKPAPTDAELLAVAKPAKIAALKAERDAAEVEPITYNGNLYDYDDKARERINAAIIALDVQTAKAKSTASIDWTTADNQDVKVTADDLRCVIASVANRSNALHVAYRAAKDKVEQATTVAEVDAVTLSV
ncbi:DUF4376 domain-containing protein [Phascolarctobacterium succinatutens]|uniref:DUF4376 domain-containing protein n=1 Tax=Phascolarctobacterium succinatutens TaxID=626940 RepID=UPI0026F29035|nr:DUF4376 domain-containing protein [Phascolarctobacterium succinatutens]